MKSNTQKKAGNNKYTKLQRRTLITCAVVMVIYVALAYFVAKGSFWTFAAAHVALAAIAIFFIWLGGAPKGVTYAAVSLSLIGAVIASALILYYLIILSNLANG